MQQVRAWLQELHSEAVVLEVLTRVLDEWSYEDAEYLDACYSLTQCIRLRGVRFLASTDMLKEYLLSYAESRDDHSHSN